MIIQLALTLFGILFLRSPGHFDPENLYREIPTASHQQETLELPRTFTYIGEGAQVYAFVSEDGKTVLKLFKAQHRKSHKLSRIIELLQRSKTDREVSGKKWRWKFDETTRRYKLAISDLQEETGLIHLHFEKTTSPLIVHLIDKYTHELDLSPLPFILQKKVELAPDYFTRLKEEGNQEQLSQAKQALKQFFLTRAQKGYTDPRQSLSVNYGFLEGRPIQIDVGKIEAFNGDLNREMEKIHAKVDEWTRQFDGSL